MIDSDPTSYLRSLFDTAVASADPAFCVAHHLPHLPRGRVLVIAAGKAAASMARAVEAAWPDIDLTGIALCPYGHGMTCERIEVIEAAHPVPDDRGEIAARRILAETEQLGADDLLLFLVSGGGSSLLALPGGDLTLADKAVVNRALLHSGAPISAMNAVRKRLSAIKGGRLAVAAHPARVVTLGISDVPGDDFGTIASGPTIPERTTRDDVEAILSSTAIDLPPSVRTHLYGPESDVPAPDHPAFQTAQSILVSRPADMLAAAIRQAKADGHAIVSLGADIEGEARDVGQAHARLALEQAAKGTPCLILSGGETTVTVRSGAPVGRGGRNTEYLLALALELNGAPGIFALAADTDGIDGAESIAGATITPDTLARAAALGLDPQAMLDGHDSATLFRALGDTIETGPTRTNVNDFRAIWINPTAT